MLHLQNKVMNIATVHIINTISHICEKSIHTYAIKHKFLKQIFWQTTFVIFNSLDTVRQVIPDARTNMIQGLVQNLHFSLVLQIDQFMTSGIFYLR